MVPGLTTKATDLIIYGIALVYGYAGSMDFAAINEAVSGTTGGRALLLGGIGLMVLLAGQLLPQIDFSIVNVALPSIRQGVDASPADVQWVVSGYALTFGLTLVAGGQTFTADRPDMVAGGDFPAYGRLLPELDAGVSGQPTWDAGYMADIAKLARHLKASRDTVAVRLLVADEMKPSLWYVSGCQHGAALYLLMPIRRG